MHSYVLEVPPLEEKSAKQYLISSLKWQCLSFIVYAHQQCNVWHTHLFRAIRRRFHPHCHHYWRRYWHCHPCCWFNILSRWIETSMSFTIISQDIAGTAIAMFAKISFYDFLFNFSVTGQLGKVWGTRKWNNMLIKIAAAGKN